jgi:hypothetical protein
MSQVLHITGRPTLMPAPDSIGGEKAPAPHPPGGILVAPFSVLEAIMHEKMGLAHLKTDPEGLTEKLLRR